MKTRLLVLLMSLAACAGSLHAAKIQHPASQAVSQSVSQKIDLNKADAETLTGSFKGIGKKRAEAIVAYRTAHHGFKNIQELAEVKGFSENFVKKNLEELQSRFTVSG